MPTLTGAPVVIVGGGIAGSSAALSLAREGRRSVVLEQADGFHELGAGIQMPPKAFKVFEHLGVLESALQAASFPENLILNDILSGEEVIRLPVGDPGFRDLFGFRYALMYRVDLLSILLDACRASGLVELRTGCRVIDVRNLPDGGAVAVLEGGDVVRGAAVIGCDGLWSVTRAHVVGDGPPSTEGDTIYRGIVPYDEIPTELYQESVVMWGGPHLDFAHYPVRRGELYNMAGIARLPAGTSTEDEAALFLSQFERACAEVQELLPKLDMSRSWLLYDREPTRTWVDGSIALLGDAAHPSYHYIAQGACMALEDSVVFGRSIATIPDIEAALVAYRDERYLRTARVQLTARQFGDLYHASGVYRDLRRSVLGSTSPDEVYSKMSWLFDGVV